MGESTLEGTGFAVAGWFQLAVAFFVITRPSRAVLQAAILGSIALIAAWVVSRTAGLPFGAHAWHAEAVTFIDATCVGLEVGLIALAALLLLRPDIDAGWDASTRITASAAPVLVLLLTTLALASPSARDHASASHGVHGHEDDRGLSLLSNGHHHDIVQYELDPATQAALDAQLKITREVARQYPTVADAEAAGYRRAGPYSPGLGAHYITYGPAALNADGVVDEDDLRHPLAIIYDGTEPDSPVAGFMYYSMSATEPQGFVSQNDTWHYHENVCLKTSNGVIDAPLGADNEVSQAQCAAVGGSLLTVTQWMAHVWSVPGYDDVDAGVFAEVNPELTCPDGTYYQRPIEEWVDNLLTTCRLGS
jgi:hypothetical protein